jgi:FAD:protein FMN transferase
MCWVRWNWTISLPATRPIQAIEDDHAVTQTLCLHCGSRGRPADVFAARHGGARAVVWRGVAMGAMASMTLVHPDRAAAKRLIERCLAEISRLEAIFSLYRPDSALVRLNAEGVLDHPPLELVEVMSFAASLARHSDGAFDVTVQPLFELYARHFAGPAPIPPGRRRHASPRRCELVDHRNVDVASDRIALGRPA